jgi:hypothetical protein
MTDGDDDKVYGAMGVAKTIGTVCVLSPLRSFNLIKLRRLSRVLTSPEILSQVQEVIIPIIQFTLENKLIGASALFVA